jgi:hypothetical protein
MIFVPLKTVFGRLSVAFIFVLSFISNVTAFVVLFQIRQMYDLVVFMLVALDLVIILALLVHPDRLIARVTPFYAVKDSNAP